MKHFAGSILVAVIVALGVLTLTFGAGFAQASEEWPAWLKKAMSKEKRVKRGKKFDFADGAVSGRMPGKFIDKPKNENDIWYWSTNIGGDGPMECWTFLDPVNTAYATSAMTEAVITGLGEQLGELKTRSIFGLDVGHVEGRPLLSVDWLYTVGEAPESQVGLLKMSSAVVNDTTLVCAHNEIGYRATFKESFRRLVGSLVTPPLPNTYYEALYLNSVGGRPVGFTQMVFLRDKDGDTKSYVSDAMLLPVDNSTVSSSDSTNVEFSSAEGQLINAWSNDFQNGESRTELQLEWLEEEWVVSGTFQGKALKTRLATKDPIVSSLGSVLQTRALQQRIKKAGAKAQISLPTWLPEADPTKLLTADIELEANGRDGVMSLGPLQMNVVMDGAGNMRRGSYELGSAELTVTRVWEQGVIPTPTN